MKIKNKLTSNHKYLLISILGVAFFVLTTVLVSIIYIVEREEEIKLENNTRLWAKSLAQASTSYLVGSSEKSHKEAKIKLKELITPNDINYVHIYKKNDDDITYFTGFNKNIYYPSIPNKITQLETLSTLKHNENSIEFVVKIEKDKKAVGYLYIQSSKKSINDLNRKLIFMAALLLLFGLSLFLMLTYKIKNKINHAITVMVELIQEISTSKNYNKRIDSLSIIELDVLSKNINILLNRTEKYIIKKDNTHQEALSQNSLLAEKVQIRTNALKESNQELLSTLEKLHQFQGQLVETEKMASLGDMVAGIAHEINTPIGLGVTASTLLNDRLVEIKTAFEDKSLKSSQLKKFLTQGEENIGIIYRNLDRAAKLISSFKKVAVDQSSIETHPFDFRELLNEVSLTLKSKLNEHNVNLIINCPENLIIESKAESVNQILINLILNSIIHGFENKIDGEIYISVLYLSNQLHLTYKDNGIGIHESIKPKIFEPFTTTKRGNGGSGLGLHLVFNIVTQALNGHIDFESEIDLGTKFNITFPTNLVSDT